ncbi:hypothetical protein M6B22_11255 [Jatrophihabitans cynanchi]|uniref:Uncharacterized protein n=1 Tax=Jatrophihabitans cynanchi TaxID=2944128 RepID=A0ABY7JTW9_9ACTN|nr:hypothetical protein [Jatrophihabitans sp. SB3-54]WAX55138.1 hypothetical protein M6B22_11255 [Jatrophihabitans sp. SB3-54]
MSEQVFDGMSIREHAGQVAESVRAINHLSLPWVVEESLPYPSDVAVVVAELARAAHGLRQATAQLADRIERLEQAGHIRDADPDPTHPDRAALACLLLSVSVAAATGRLATALDSAQQHLSCLACAEQTTLSTHTATPDTTPTAAEPTELRRLAR